MVHEGAAHRAHGEAAEDRLVAKRRTRGREPHPRLMHEGRRLQGMARALAAEELPCNGAQFVIRELQVAVDLLSAVGVIAVWLIVPSVSWRHDGAQDSQRAALLQVSFALSRRRRYARRSR